MREGSVENLPWGKPSIARYGTRLAPSACYIELDGYGVDLVVLSFEQGPQFRPCYIQRLRKYTSFCSDCHEVCVTDPARQNMQVDVVGDPCACRFPEIETHIEAARFVNFAE